MDGIPEQESPQKAEYQAPRTSVREWMTEDAYYLNIAANLLDTNAAEAIEVLVRNGYKNPADHLRSKVESINLAFAVMDMDEEATDG